jgi:hypothetical protein
MLEYPFERNLHVGVKYYEIKTADLRVFLQQRKWWLDL